MWLLLACGPMPMEARLGPPPFVGDTGLPAGESAAETDGTAPPDTAPEESGGDTGEPPEETDDETAEETAEPVHEVCWLGPDRDYRVCVPTVPWSSSFGSEYDYPPPYGGAPQYAEPTRFVDLEALDADLPIAPNFVLSEYMEAWKGRYGILQVHHLDELQAIRDAIGGPLTITSGYRNPSYNASVGGVTYSRHQYGDGADLDASGWSVEELGEICEDLHAGYVGLYEDGHTHCDWRDETLDPAYWPSSFTSAPSPRETLSARLVEGPAWTAPATGFDEGEPFRRWTAWDADGAVLVSTTGRSFVPPAGTARFRVLVGGQVELYGP